MVWNSALAVSEIHSVLPGEAKLLIYGRLNESAERGHECFASVDWKTGTVVSFDQLTNAAHPVSQPQ